MKPNMIQANQRTTGQLRGKMVTKLPQGDLGYLGVPDQNGKDQPTSPMTKGSTIHGYGWLVSQVGRRWPTQPWEARAGWMVSYGSPG